MDEAHFGLVHFGLDWILVDGSSKAFVQFPSTKGKF